MEGFLEGPPPAAMAAFLLVEAGGPMIATRPDRPFSHLIGEFGRKIGPRSLKTFQERFL
jgi:hypothetical protein